MKYGYCRISRPKQSIERQIRNIKAQYQDSVIVQEVFTRTRMDRRQWQLLMKRVKAGDTIIFDSVSRMSGNAEEGFAAYEELFNRGVNLVFLKEPHINTDTYKKALENNVQLTGSNVDYILEGVNRYLMELAKEQIRLAFEQSEKEVEDLHQRTREGIETARLNGKQIGRKKDAKITTKKSIAAKEIIRKHSRDFSGTLSDVEVMQLTGLSRNTYYKYKRELKASRDQYTSPKTLNFFDDVSENLHRNRHCSLEISFFICYNNSGLIIFADFGKDIKRGALCKSNEMYI